jgi:hypothetical protein
MDIPIILGVLGTGAAGLWKIVTLSHKSGKTEQRIDNLEKQLDKIDEKLDTIIYDLRCGKSN